MARLSRSPRNASARGLALFLTAVAIVQFGPARGEPGDIFVSPAPVLGSDPPKASDVREGDASVSTQTGALQYSYPIEVPPGRNGMAPSLALSYSSQAPIYGGIAAGWSLSIPAITEDTSEGRLRTHSPESEASQGPLAGLDDRFASSLAGGRPLVNVSEPTSADVYLTYRAQNDASFARYERMKPGVPYRWRVYTTDGKVMYFGDTSLAGACSNLSDGFAPLTRQVDAFGSEVAYQYESEAGGECRIRQITWGQHPPSGLTQPFAQVAFEWNEVLHCGGVPIGSQSSYRTGRLVVTGASRLMAIVSTAFSPGSPGTPEHTRRVTLAYSAASEGCEEQHSPVRQLASIQESAWGTDAPRVDLPAVRFEYGSPKIELITPQVVYGTPWDSVEPRPSTLAWGYRRNDDRWPTVEAMLLDIDGDGLLDRVVDASTETEPGDGECRARWKKNLGPPVGSTHPAFAASQPLLTFPRLKWNGSDLGGAPPAGAPNADPEFPNREDCALNGQATAFRNSVDAFGICHNNTSCAPGTSAPGPFCYPGGTECTPGAGGGDGSFRTYLAYRWLDMDADGLVDLVAAVHGDIDIYDIVQGNRLYNGSPRPPEPAIFGAYPTCPNMERCRQVDYSCIDQARICNASNVCTINYTALNACLNQAPAVPCFALTKETPPVGLGPKYRAPYSRCEGLYPWFIYKNLGRGNFATAPTIKYQPIPLESDAGDSGMITGKPGGLSAENHAVTDFDGDGVLDAIVHPNDSQASHWFVWLGDGNGGFGPVRYTFPTRPGHGISTSGFNPGGWMRSSAGLFDLNGDGLLEHWRTPDIQQALNANLAFHDGTQHRLLQTPGGLVGEIETPQGSTYGVKTGNDSKATVTSWDGQFPKAGSSTALNRTIDVDVDGRADVVQYITGTFTPTVFFNMGGQFTTLGPSYAGDYSGFLRTIRAYDGGPDELSWELQGDLMDLDGNGIPEAAYFGAEGFVRAEHNPLAPAPRLLRAIHGGTGAHTAITYASMRDKSAVEQHPELLWSDNRPKASPSTQWVVKSMTVTDDFAATTATTTQYYKSPRHGRDDRGSYGFRGFEEVSTTGPSGATTVSRYAYSPDWSGRLVATLVRPAEAPAEVRSIDRTTWTERTLFAGTIKTYHATLSEHLTCANGQTETTCTTASAPGYTRTTTSQTALASTTQSGGPFLLWQDTGALLQAGTAAADGDRETTTTFALHADGSTYRLRSLTSTQHQQVSGAMVMFAKSAQTWDSSYRVQLTDEVWSDTVDANRAKSATDYDMSTGNPVRRWKPKQYAAGTTSTALLYDARKLFVATETNELGHQVDYTHSYGTGATLVTSGPNTRTCTTGCPTGPLTPVKEQHKVRVDGLGRAIEVWDTTSDDGSVFTLNQREATSYVDAPTAGPTSATHQTRIDSAQSVWKQEKTEMDGQGRPIRQIVFVQGTAPADQVTAFQYGNDGTLRSVQLPDPTANSSATVTYTYGYDSLGRATSIRRPDSASAGSQSGANISYDGVTQTTTEVAGAAGGQVAVTRTVNDKFGRLIQVLEQTAAPSTWATTTYRYGPDDNVITVIDPQGITTSLTHDFAGRRTQIIRAGRTWKYTYDRNDNLIAEQVPGSTGPATDLAYTTTIAYDDLDRPASKVIGQRNLSAADQAAFGAGTESFTWDYGANGTGRLRAWRTYAPGSTTAAVALQVAHDALGNRIHTEHTLNVAGYPALLRSFHQTYYLFGGARAARYYDSLGGGNETQSTIHYDARALPQQVTLSRSGQPAQTLAVQTRNVAGLVTSRRTNTTGAMTFVESLWTYDKLGRVASQLVQKGPGPVVVARQDLTYFGNDDPKTLGHRLGAVTRQFQYAYDLRHQLTSATTTTPGYFNGTYTYGTGGRFTRATEAQTIAPLPAGSEVKPRDVNYVYGGTDPEHVTALTNVAGGQTYASYGYDAAGNQVARAYPGSNQTWDYVYDGQDQLRRATRKVGGVVSGSEEYWYDADGARIAIVKRNAAGARTELVWFIGDTQAHHDGAGAVTHVYSHLSLGTPVARVDRTSNTSAAVEYQFHGLASSTLAAVDHGGTVNASFSYTPFGSVVEATSAGGSGSGTAAHRRRHNDKYVDDLTELAYYGARYYDKTLIGWTQGDPLFRFEPETAWNEPRRASLYAFSGQNPLSYIDPDGRDWKQELAAGIEIDFDTGEMEVDRTGAATQVVAAVIGAACKLNPYTAVANTVLTIATSDPPPEADYERVMSGNATQEDIAALEYAADNLGPGGGGGGVPGARKVQGNSSSSDKTQHTYDIVRTKADGKTRPVGTVKNGVSGEPLTKTKGDSPRANRQVNKLNAEAIDQGRKDRYKAKVTRKKVNSTKRGSARQRALDFEKKDAEKHYRNGQPMDKHRRPKPPPPDDDDE